MFSELRSKSKKFVTSTFQRAEEKPENDYTRSWKTPFTKCISYISSTAKSKLQHLKAFKSYKKLIPLTESNERVKDCAPLPKKHFNKPPVLPSPISTSTEVPLFPLSASTEVPLSPGSQGDSPKQKAPPKRRHTYKLFPPSPPRQIISPVYGVNVLHRDIEACDLKDVLPRLRGHHYNKLNTKLSAGHEKNSTIWKEIESRGKIHGPHQIDNQKENKQSMEGTDSASHYHELYESSVVYNHAPQSRAHVCRGDGNQLFNLRPIRA